MDTSNWTRENLAWLAGIIEGEGSFCPDYGRRKREHQKEYFRLRIMLGMTDFDVVERAATIAGTGTLHTRTNNGPGRKPLRVLSIERQHDAYALMVALYPWMGERRAAAIRDQLAKWREIFPTLSLQRQESYSAVERARRIRELYATGRYKQTTLADAFGLHSSYVSRLVNNKKMPFT